jgi:protein-L-isoaspartate(D-aspartate) O-methyltransferase
MDANSSDASLVDFKYRDNGSSGGDRADREARFAALRSRMVDDQIATRGIHNPMVLAAMAEVPRHRFMDRESWEKAYEDRPYGIGYGQTISQPYIVALMTDLARPVADDRALEIGTGCGYQAAVLSRLVSEVYSIEIIEPLADRARETLATLGYDNVQVRCGDGYGGWADSGPFEIILVAAAPEHVPLPLVEQLAPGGRMVIPVGGDYQELMVIERADDGTLHQSSVAPVVFVPMTGEAQVHGG